MGFKISEDRSKFFSMSLPRKFVKEAEKFDREMEQKEMDWFEKRKLEEELQNKWMINFHILDMDALHVATHKERYSLLKECVVWRNDLNLVQVRSDGICIYQILQGKGKPDSKDF